MDSPQNVPTVSVFHVDGHHLGHWQPPHLMTVDNVEVGTTIEVSLADSGETMPCRVDGFTRMKDMRRGTDVIRLTVTPVDATA